MEQGVDDDESTRRSRMLLRGIKNAQEATISIEALYKSRWIAQGT